MCRVFLFMVLMVCAVRGGSEDPSEMLFKNGAFLQVQRKFDDACSAYANVIEKYPSSQWSCEAQFHLAEVFHLQGRWEDAEREYETLYVKYPTVGWTQVGLLEMGKHYAALQGGPAAQKAIQNFMRLIDLRPEGPVEEMARYALGDCQLRAGMLQESARNFEALLGTGWAPSAHFSLGTIYTDPRSGMKDFDKALVHFKTIIQAYSQSPYVIQAVFGSGECYRQMGRYEEAIQCYEQVLSSEQAGVWKSIATEQLQRCKDLLQKASDSLQEVNLLQDLTDEKGHVEQVTVSARKIIYEGDVRLKFGNMDIQASSVEIDVPTRNLKIFGNATVLVDGRPRALQNGAPVTFQLKDGDQTAIQVGAASQAQDAAEPGVLHQASDR